MGLVSLIRQKMFEPPEKINLPSLTKKQAKRIREGYSVTLLEKVEFRPRIFSIFLSSDADPDNLKESDVIIRDVTGALILAGYNIEKLRKSLRRKR